jgi:hypothetical protein
VLILVKWIDKWLQNNILGRYLDVLKLLIFDSLILDIALDNPINFSNFLCLLLCIIFNLFLWDFEIYMNVLNGSLVKIFHKKLYDHFWNFLGISYVQLFFLILVKTYLLETLQDVHGHLVDLLLKFLEHRWMEEKPYTVWEEKICLGGYDDKF